MTKNEIIKFINANPLFFVATTEGDTPHVRGMRAHKADNNGIIFFTSKDKAVYQQLNLNPKVEICFFDFQNVIQVRANGKLESVEDLEIKKEIAAIRPNGKAIIEKQGYDMMAVFKLKNAKISIWSLKPMDTSPSILDL
jgi:pyridoxamine 5'-phosphate oxidase